MNKKINLPLNESKNELNTKVNVILIGAAGHQGKHIEEPVNEENSEIAKGASGDLTYDDFTYFVSGNNATITGYEGSASYISVPSSKKWY